MLTIIQPQCGNYCNWLSVGGDMKVTLGNDSAKKVLVLHILLNLSPLVGCLL